MTEYTYTRRNLFEAPEYYHYAQCNQAGYLEAWRKSRRDFVGALVQARPTATGPAMDEAEPLEARLAGLAAEVGRTGSFSADAADVVNRLVHKYEVSRRLYQRYADDWRRLEGVPAAGLQTYLWFAELLILHCRHIPRDRQKLSTLLKVCDALASLDPAVYSAVQSRALEAILAAECELVDQLAREIR